MIAEINTIAYIYMQGVKKNNAHTWALSAILKETSTEQKDKTYE